jgi:tRNA threonylcarbamoyladenosine biosynthesis protein TsaE
MSLVLATKSADDTREIGVAVAALAKGGDTVLLAGDLGAGKTTFTQGFGRGLGVEDRVTSPTFTLVHQYRGGRVPLVHVDIYRIEQLQEVVDLALAELLDDGAAVLIEWGDVAAPVLPADFLEVRIEFGEGDDDRRFLLRTVGPRWSPRVSALGRACDAWRVDET